jgi:hypothetical protein
VTWSGRKNIRANRRDRRANALLIITLPIRTNCKIANRKQLQFALRKILAIFFSGHLSRARGGVMTDDLSDPQQWRDNIEARVGTLEATVTTEAQLRATMDFDMGKMQSEFRAQRSMLQALHVTQQDHNRRLTGVEDRLTGVEGRLTNIEGGLELVRVGVEALHGKLDLLIDKN